MPGWLSSSLSSASEAPPWLLAWRIGVAIALGVVVTGLHRWSKRSDSITPTFGVTLILLSGLIAMATQVIGDNVARAFSLVGALSVVRFRTVVKDTQDTAFVILAVVVGMSAGANHLAVGLVGLALFVVAAPFLWPPRPRDRWDREDAILRLKVDQYDMVRPAVEAAMLPALSRQRLISASTAKKGSALDLSYSVRLRPGGSPLELIAELNRIEGVSGVDLSQDG